MGKRMEEHLRFAVCLLAQFRLAGRRPLRRADLRAAVVRRHDGAGPLKADVAFEMFDLLGVPFFCFHDADVRPEGREFRRIEGAARRDRRLPRGRRWRPRRPASSGARRTSSPTAASWPAPPPTPTPTSSPTRRHREGLHRRDHRLGGQNYVLWGGREGYETLLNTDLGRSGSRRGGSCRWSSTTSTASASRARS
jgi:xylose isomerase